MFELGLERSLRGAGICLAIGQISMALDPMSFQEHSLDLVESTGLSADVHWGV